MKLWMIIAAVGAIGFISSIAAVEYASSQKMEITIETFIPVFLIVTIVAICFLVYKIVFEKRRNDMKNRMERTGLSINEARFIAALHLLNAHSIDIFVAGKTPESAKYSATLVANRCFPAAGEQANYVRLIMTDKRYFDGLTTKIIVYMDGVGNVTDDFIMNEALTVDNELWRRPEIYFLKGVSKTSKARSLQDIVSRHVLETGEFPKDFQPGQLEGYRDPEPKKE